jgi:hypothetical protein
MSKDERSARKLSFARANAICRNIVGIGDHVFSYAEALKLSGFSAFEPHLRFVEGFCDTEEATNLHRACLIEVAKVSLGTPWPMWLRATPAERESIYSSELFKRLCRERDELNGVPVERIYERYPGEGWRREVDPCKRDMMRVGATDRQTYGERWQAMLDEQGRLLQSEVARHATGLADHYIGRRAFYVAAMTQYSSPHGFVRDRVKSSEAFPIFSKSVSEDWDLCWTLQEEEWLLRGLFVPYLELRHRRLRGRIENRQSGEFLWFRYKLIIPSFGTAYWKFSDLKQLETIIKAHLCFYKLIAPILEPGIVQALGDKAVMQ